MWENRWSPMTNDSNLEGFETQDDSPCAKCLTTTPMLHHHWWFSPVLAICFFFFRKPRVTSWWFGSSNHRTLSFESPMLINNPRKALVVHLFSSMSFLSTFSTLFIRSTLGFLWFSWFLVLFPLSLMMAPLVGPRFWVFSAGKSPNVCWWHSQSLLHIPSGKHTQIWKNHHV